MPYKFDYHNGDVVAWTATSDGATATRIDSYTPTIYVGADEHEELATAKQHLTELPAVSRTTVEQWRTGFRHDEEAVLRVDIEHIDAVSDVASTIAGWGTPGTYRLYNVDLTREFRFCLETEQDPVPDRSLRTVSIDAPTAQLAREHLQSIAVDGDTVEGETEILKTITERLETIDPHVLSLSSSRLVPQLYELADQCGMESFDLGRLAGYDTLAGQSTYESYGQVGHSPARYNVPGRVIVDRSNTFMWTETNLAGCLYLSEQSGLPLQELAWASIGRILTAIQISHARDRNVLVPWHSWRHERFKSMRQLHDADRGGFTLAPDVGVHDNIHELDFSSLYPNIIVTRNISPETVRCECHPDPADVPGLGYSICPEPGYLPDVLEPLIEDRDAMKRELRETDDPQRRAALNGQSSAIKWILVSCFGYQGFSNAKFGRIECHEAINAYAREILLAAKTILESNGWQVVHGIVDSLWVTPQPDTSQTSIDTLCEMVTAESDIRLEHEAAYDWVAFVPQRNSDTGALTKYFGRSTDGEYKYRGIECRQRSTPTFIKQTQRELVKTLAEHKDPERVCELLAARLDELRSGTIPTDDLRVEIRVSKSVDAYTRNTRVAAATARAKQLGCPKQPGEQISFVVVDDDVSTVDRVQLAFEQPETYDPEFYTTQLSRAAESVLSPLGWTEQKIRSYLSDRTDTSLVRYYS
ncbi:type B DNA-directed DNA polymerase [Halalkalirubrum salinum]|uniref:type B DNA-directed DNA polymerase n=1 Tax=Halalkalirubrum salinum TaxID=2563889 RepID=UPI0010FB9AD4|nr:type B DNA-directed DNA polymerase [Halalkalirubrum salinum]